jgi:hypothetical protein
LGTSNWPGLALVIRSEVEVSESLVKSNPKISMGHSLLMVLISLVPKSKNFAG